MKMFVKTVWVAAASGFPLAKVAGFATYSWPAAFLPIIAPAGFAVCVIALAMLGHALNYIGLAPFGRKK